MQMSNLSAIALAVVPGQAEMLEKVSVAKGNLPFNGLALQVKWMRNCLYIDIALMIIGTVGAILSQIGTFVWIVSIVSVSFGSVFARFHIPKLWEATLLIQKLLNLGVGP